MMTARPMNLAASPPVSDSYDVVILGGALSGAATATLLLQRNPGIRVLIIERSEKLTRRVGEATVEVSAYFLSRVLGLTKYLNETQIAKQGLRFWFQNDKVNALDEASEIGPRYQVRLPSYQLDRATLDEEVLSRAIAAGAEILRPAVIRNVELHDGGQQAVDYKYQGETRTVKARWVVDASGVAALLARKNGWWQRNTEHPTASARDSEMLQQLLFEEFEGRKIAPMLAPEHLLKLRSALGEVEFRKLSIAAVGREVGAKQIIYVDLAQSSIEAAVGSDFVRGRASVNVRVIDAETGDTVWPLEVSQGYPVSWETPMPKANERTDEALARSQLHHGMALRIGRLFRKWKPDEDGLTYQE